MQGHHQHQQQVCQQLNTNATHCNFVSTHGLAWLIHVMHCRLQQTATDCNRLQQTTKDCNRLQQTATDCKTLQHTATDLVFTHGLHIRTSFIVDRKCRYLCCSVLQCVAVCCSALQCVAVRCSALQCVAVCCSLLQCVAVYLVVIYEHAL